MAKTTSQIIAENKIKRAEAAAISASRDKINQQQMAGVAEKSTAKTLAVLTKAISGTSDPKKKSELSRAAQMVTDEYEKFRSQQKSGPKTAMDMQKKKEDRIEEKNQIDSLQIKKDRAQKALDDFYNNKEIDWTDTNQRKAYDAEIKRLQAEVDHYKQQMDAEENQRIRDADMKEIDSMSEEDREQLRQYISSDSKTGNLLVNSNPLLWFKENQALGDSAKYLFGKYGEEKTKQLASSYSRYLNEKEAENIKEDTKNAVDESIASAVGHNILGIGTRLFGGLQATADRFREALDRDERYSTLAPINSGDLISLHGNAVTAQTAQNIAGDVFDQNGLQVKDGGILRQGAAYLYQGGMTMVDSFARVAAGGGPAGAAAIAACNSFSQTVSQASQQGAAPDQAYKLGAAVAGIEYLSEKIPMDEVFKLAKAGKTKVLAQAFRQAGIEISTEELSLLCSMAAEAAILREKSSYKQQIGDLVANGVSYEDAKKQADNAVWEEAKQTAFASGFSGFLSGGGGAIVGNLTAQQEAAAEIAKETSEGTPVVESAQPEPTPFLDDAAQQLAQEAPFAKTETEEYDGLTDAQRYFLEAEKARNAKPDINRALQQTADEFVDKIPVNEPEAKTAEQAGLDAAIQRTMQEQMNRKGEQEVYEALKAAKKEQKDLQKEIDRAERRLAETGKGSKSRIDQLRAKLEQQNDLVRQLESQNQYFTGDYERTVGEAVRRQETIFADAKARAAQAISDFEAGRITEAQKNTEVDAYNRAGAELKRLMGMTQEQYRADLAEAGLIADTENMPALKADVQEGTGSPGVDAKSEEATESAPDGGMQADAQGNTESYTPDADLGASGQAAQVPPNTENPVPPNRSPAADTQNVPAEDGQQQGVEGIKGTGAAEADTTGMQNTPSGDFKDSKTFTNTGLNSADEGIRAGYQETVEQDPFSPKYEVKHNADTSETAQERTSTPERVRSEYNYLMSKNEAWTAEDVVTARLAAKELLKLGEADKTAEMNIRLKEVLSNMGQSIQAASITGTMQDAADSATAVETATNRIFDMKQEDSTFQQKKDGQTYQQWQKETAVNIARIGSEIEKVPDGDAGAMRAIIRQIARDRKTTAWFGMSDRMSGTANRILNKLDFDTLKKIANTQVAAMPDDFKKRTKTDIMLGIRKQNMLTSLKTFKRNISGNTAVGLVDSASDSTAGRIADLILSQVTGKKTVGSDITHGKAYLDAAKSAGEFASLCVELNIPIETDIDSSYGAVSGDGGGRYIGKTFRSQGNFAMRAMYAYQKYMSYALEVTDKIFEGGTNAAVAESLSNLKNSGLSDTDIQDLSEYTANRRTFKDATWEDSRGEHGSTLSRVTQNLKNIGEGTAVEKPIKVAADMIIPFASVPMNVAQTGIDYTAGTVKGLTEMISIARDAKAGKEISAVRQRQAVTDFGRGITGTAMIGLLATAAAKGIIRVSNAKDKDEKALAQAEGRTGAQINWDAAQRSLDGESEEWMDGDTISGLDFLEPFDTQMYLACELAQEDTMQGVLKALPGATVRSVFNSFMDSPAMTGLSNIEDLISDFAEAETAEDALGAAAGYAGNLATSFIPQVVRQAAQNMDGYYRDTRGADNLEYAKNNIMAAIPGMSQELPKKISGLGEEQQRGNWMETFFDPTATKTYRKNEITGYLDELSGRTGDKTIYPDRQAPMRITGADGRKIELDGEKRETYQRVYGEKVNYYYAGLYNNSDFQNLPDDLKIAALGKAKEYATGHAKAAVSDYHDEKEEKSGDFVKKIVTDVTVNAITDIFNDMDTAKEYGYDNQPNIDRMEDAYDQYAGMTKDERSRVMEKAAGDTAKYLEIRDKGVSTDTYIRALKRVSAQTVQPGYTQIRPAQELTAIAGTPGATEKTIDILMKAYMTDYDPNAKKPDTTELKYDYARKELGYSPKQYALGYDIYSHEKSVGGDGTADRTRERLEKELGISKNDAKKLYRLLNGNWKPWNE